MSEPQRGAGPAAGLTYRDAGVDREAASRAKRGIADLVRSTARPEVLSGPGSFGGLFRVPAGYRRPVLVASADGVGTKLKVAMRAGRHDTVGHDLVNHCVNDILVEGARPLFFLDYIGMGRLEAGVVEQLVAGVAAGCRANGCALLGGETAEMPDFYAPGEYDLAGFIVGIVEEDGRPGAHRVQAGDQLLGLASSGFHTNGYSLLRRLLFDRLGLGPDDAFPDSDATVADVLLRVHRSYLDAVAPLLDAGLVHALAHITGGGIPENLARVLPPGLEARVDTSAWEPPAEFSAVAELGAVDRAEMFRTFNMGVGMILVVPPTGVDEAARRVRAAGVDAWRLGEVQPGAGGVALH
ncbi:MAG TPA: phosphoribosylformylglycinamidine cyclo-ligase [Longimicrobiales bacterium]